MPPASAVARAEGHDFRYITPVTALLDTIIRAFELRKDLAGPDSAIRLFNGYTEGLPGLTVELFGRTLIASSQSSGEADEAVPPRALVEAARTVFPALRAAAYKFRASSDPESERGRLYFGDERDVTRTIEEDGVRYALSLLGHRDAGFFLDTRELRRYLRSELGGKSVLNAFAYTGSLGVAAAAGGARRVLQLDKNRALLNLGKDSYSLNGLAIKKADFRAQDFFVATAELRRKGELFDCVIVDAPFFASSGRGRVDLAAEFGRLLNKARPLVGDGGTLVAVNNALFVSGAEYLRVVEELSRDGYVTFERRIDVPADVIGLARSGAPSWPADPAPFEYPTKIGVLGVRRKDGRKAGE